MMTAVRSCPQVQIAVTTMTPVAPAPTTSASVHAPIAPPTPQPTPAPQLSTDSTTQHTSQSAQQSSPQLVAATNQLTPQPTPQVTPQLVPQSALRPASFASSQLSPATQVTPPPAQSSHPPAQQHQVQQQLTQQQQNSHQHHQVLQTQLPCPQGQINVQPQVQTQCPWPLCGQVLKIPDVWSIVLSVTVGVAFGIPTWLGLKLQAWTGRKDFYEVCLETIVGFSLMICIAKTDVVIKNTLKGVKQQQRQRAIADGLPPPPLTSFKRSSEHRKSSYNIRLSLRLMHKVVNREQDATIAPESTQWESALLTGGFLFLVSTIAIVCGRAARLQLQSDAIGFRYKSESKDFRTALRNKVAVLISCLVVVLTSSTIVYYTISLRDAIGLAAEAFVAHCALQKV